MITDIELGWLAGLLEGEGSFTMNSDSKGVRVQLAMTDEDIVLRASIIIQSITGKRHTVYCYDAPKGKPDWSAAYKLGICGKDAKKVMKRIVRLMGQRRRKKIWQLLNGYRQPKVSMSKDDIVKLVINNRKLA